MKSASSNVLKLSAAVAFAVVAISGPAYAGTATSNLTVSAEVSANCTISTSAVAFGAYDPVSANASTALDGTGTVSVTCTQGSAASITLGQGSHADTGSTDAAPERRLNDAGSNYLSYDLYSDTGRTAIWGNDATVDADHTGTGTSTDITVYGQVPAGQNVPTGSYTDSVVATVTF